jgi:hypothetical protein
MIRAVTSTMGLLLCLASAARAAAGACTITAFSQPNPNLGFNFGIPVAVGVAMPVTFDEAAGTFSMSRNAWYSEFGDLGAAFVTIGGVRGFLRMFNGEVPGVIDANGQILMKNFDVENSTEFTFPTCPADVASCPDYPVTGIDASTGLQLRVLSGRTYIFEGAPIDFATGAVRITGAGFLEGSVGSSGTNLSGFDMRCTLNPIPAQASLVAGAVVAKVAGKAKVDASAEQGDKGDQLTLKFNLAPGATPLDLTGASPFLLRLGDLTLAVRAGKFQVKGKKLIAKRDDTCKIKKGATTGVCKADGTSSCATFEDCESKAGLEVVSGRKATEAVQSQLGGLLTLANGKKGATIVMKLQGLDLAGLAGAQSLRTAIGGVNASQAVTVTNGAIK